MDYVLSLSYGKDSMACLGAIEKLGWPLTKIVTVDIWATNEILGVAPPHAEFKKYADKVILDRWGIEVEHICAREKDGGKKTFEGQFYKPRKYSRNGNDVHRIHGWPLTNGAWCNDRLKVNVIKQSCANNDVHYLGIALDEPERLARLKNNDVSPLKEIGWTEKDCYAWCRENQLLSPIYETELRDGCWFCPKQNIGSLRRLRKAYPEYWDLMLKWDNDSLVSFKADGHTVHDYEKRFELEDRGLIKDSDRYAWKKMKKILEGENESSSGL